MQAERRLSQQLIDYWFSLKKSKSDIPQEDNISPEDIADIWTNCFLIKQGVQGNPAGFRYSYVGETITENCIESPPHIRRFLENMLRLHESAAIHAEKALDKEEPVIEEGEFLDHESTCNFLYRRCFMPFKDSKKGTNTVLGGFRWKIET